MSERELLSRLMSQTLLENIDGQAFDLASEPNTMVNISTADNRTLFNKIIPFVLAKEPMQQLLKTVIPAGSVKTIRIKLTDKIEDWSYAFMRNYRNLVTPMNGQFDQYTTTGESVYTQSKIEEDFLERYLPDIITQVEFGILMTLYAAWYESPIVVEALSQYVATQYVTPLEETIPGANVQFRFVTPSDDRPHDPRSYVLFVVNVDGVEHPEHINCLARVNEGFYHISIQEGRVPC